MENQKPKIYTDKVLAITSLSFVLILVAGLAIYSEASIKLASIDVVSTSIFTTPVLLFVFIHHFYHDVGI